MFVALKTYCSNTLTLLHGLALCSLLVQNRHTLCAGELQRLRELLADVTKPGEKVLRLTVEAGGCSGFSYRSAHTVT